jgi:hypothetical protein
MKYVGGCLCGALRYASQSEPIESGYCHCRTCQRSSGAPVLVWATFPIEHFQYTSGKPTIYRSSDIGSREFCSSCGTQIAFRELPDPKTVDVMVGSLDQPERITPTCHIWCRSRISWFETADDLIKYEEDAPPENGT